MGQGFRISVKGPFSLAASTQFLEGFTPAAYPGGEPAGHLHLAFPVEGTWSPVGVCVRQTTGSVVGRFVGEAGRAAVGNQVARILSLDVDGSGFERIGRLDSVVGRLQRRFPGLRPVNFWSPYEAAAWAIIGQRIRMGHAARIKQRMAEELGPEVEIDGQRLHAFPAPAELAKMGAFHGLADTKVARLRDLGAAAAKGLLHGERLRSLPDPLGHLKQISGIGDFSAELILVRGAGEPDHWPRREQRLQRAMVSAYELDDPTSVDVLEAIAEKWRPYRSWVSVLFRAADSEQ